MCFVCLFVWCAVFFVLSVMHVVGGFLLWVLCISSCRWCVLVPVVLPVAIMCEVFCDICSLLMFVSDSIGCHMWKRNRVWVLLWVCMLQVFIPFVFYMLM